MKNISVFLTLIVAAISLFLQPAVSSAAWSVQIKIDQMTDEESKYAAVSSKDEVFWIYERGPWKYTASFRINKSFRQINPDPKQLTMRVDKNPAKTFTITSWEPRLAFVDIDESVFTGAGFIDELINGKVLRIQYYTSFNQKQIAVFDLIGSAKAIADALPSFEPYTIRKARWDKAVNHNAELSEDQQQGIPPEVLSEGGDCLESWVQMKEMERMYQRPQLWRGCD